MAIITKLTGAQTYTGLGALTGQTTDTTAGDDTLVFPAAGLINVGDVYNGGTGIDTIQLAAGVFDFSAVTAPFVGFETITEAVPANNANVTLTATQYAALTSINLNAGDTLNVLVDNTNISAATTTSVTVGTGNLRGTAANSQITMKGEQLDAIINGIGTINLDAGADIISLTSTSADLNTLGDASIVNVETITAVQATAAVTFNLSNQTEGFTLTGGASGDTITGGAGIDNINGGTGLNTLNGGAGNDFIAGGVDADTINGGIGNDNISDAAGTNTLNGDAGDDFIAGGVDADTINGGDDNDTLIGAAGNDTLTGGAGNDSIIGGLGADTLTGDTGLDIFAATIADSDPTISAGTTQAVTITGYDVITDFLVTNAVATAEKLDVGAAVTLETTNGLAAGTIDYSGGGKFTSYTGTAQGIVTFNVGTTFAVPLTTQADVAAAVELLDLAASMNNKTAAFTATIAGVNHTYVYTNNGAVDTISKLVDLQNVKATSLSTTGLPLGQVAVLDAVAPTVVITDDKAGVTSGTGVITYTFTLSKASADFTASDITLVGGTAGAFTAVDSTHYTLAVTPLPAVTSITVDVAAAKFTDTAGNANVVAVQNVQAVDNVVPTVVITDDNAAVNDGGAITYTFTLSEANTNFLVGDIDVVGGTKGAFTVDATGKIYTLVVTPTSAGNLTVDVAANTFTDAAGNANTAATQNVQVVSATGANFIDTSVDDTFAASTGTLASATFGTGTALSYGITGGTVSVDGLTVSKANAYGTLTVTKATGAYSFAADAAAINLLGADATDSTLIVTVSDGVVPVLLSSKAFTVAITQDGITETIGNDILAGTAGADALNGLAGNDTYTVNNIGDVVTEASVLATELDTVESSITYALTSNVENLTLTGIAVIDGTGNGLDNLLLGNDANNKLDGGAGVDTLKGGAGNDTYVIDNTADKLGDNGGVDTAESSATYTLGTSSNVENLTLTGLAAINGTGTAGNNVLVGNAAANVLTGYNGVDTLTGGLGADTIVGGLGADIINLAEAIAAIDTVRVTSADSSLVTGWDMVSSFKLGTGTGTAGVDKIDLPGTVIASNIASKDGADSGAIRSHHITNGLITFDDAQTFSAAVAVTSTNLNDVLGYLQANIKGGNVVAFDTAADTYVFRDGGLNDTIVELVGVSAHSVSTTAALADSVWIG